MINWSIYVRHEFCDFVRKNGKKISLKLRNSMQSFVHDLHFPKIHFFKNAKFSELLENFEAIFTRYCMHAQ